jgi:hypothetical protein
MVEKVSLPVIKDVDPVEERNDAIQQLAFISYVSTMEPVHASKIYKPNKEGINSFRNYFNTQKPILKKLMDSELVQ